MVNWDHQWAQTASSSASAVSLGGAAIFLVPAGPGLSQNEGDDRWWLWRKSFRVGYNMVQPNSTLLNWKADCRDCKAPQLVKRREMPRVNCVGPKVIQSPQALNENMKLTYEKGWEQKGSYLSFSKGETQSTRKFETSLLLASKVGMCWSKLRQHVLYILYNISKKWSKMIWNIWQFQDVTPTTKSHSAPAGLSWASVPGFGCPALAAWNLRWTDWPVELLYTLIIINMYNYLYIYILIILCNNH